MTNGRTSEHRTTEQGRSLVFGLVRFVFGYVRFCSHPCSFGCSGCVIRKQLCWLAFVDPSLLRLGSISRGIYAPKGVLKICEQAPIFNSRLLHLRCTTTTPLGSIAAFVRLFGCSVDAFLFGYQPLWQEYFCDSGKLLLSLHPNMCVYAYAAHAREGKLC